MKELSIEEKAKRYDEALKKAKEWYDNPNSATVGKAYLFAVFPELKESEDERTRKRIIALVNAHGQGMYKEEMLAWLERKGEKEYALKSSKDEDVYKFMQQIKKEAKAYEFNLPNRDYDIYAFAKDILVWLEKQGEQKPADNVEPKFKVGDIVVVKPMVCHGEIVKGKPFEIVDITDDDYISDNGKFYSISLQDGWELVEQNLADKVEPKFKVGEWVVFNNKHQSIYQVEKIEDGYYILRHTHGGTFRVCVLHDESLRLWTIEDAMDSDVLVCNEEILLFKSYSVQGRISLYCWYNGQTNNFHNKEVVDTLMTTRNKICPATKEQRDTLFAKMKEAGYEWDAAKKELKKIENKIEISFGAKDSELQEYTYYIPKGFHAEINDNEVVIKKGEQKPAWNEEDKQYLLVCKNALAKYQTTDKWDAGIISHWLENKLKSLKDRVISQPTHGWSEEDEVNLVRTLAFIRNTSLKDVDEIKESVLTWVTSLKDRVQPKQEWNEEVSPYYDDICEILINLLHSANANINKDAVQKDLDWLKSLKERHTWKPSDEQMLALSALADFPESASDACKKTAKELLEQLKKLKG